MDSNAFKRKEIHVNWWILIKIYWLYQVKLYLRSCQDHGKENVYYYLVARSWVKQKATSSARWLVIHRFFTRTQLYINNMIRHTRHKFSKLIFFVYSKSEYTLKSVSVSVRPSVYTIIFESLIRSSWNFYHSFISKISRSSSKMSKIRPCFSGFHPQIPWFPIGFHVNSDLWGYS